MICNKKFLSFVKTGSVGIVFSILNATINDTLKESQQNIIRNKYTLTKNILLQLLEEE